MQLCTTARKTATEDGFCLRPPTSGRRLFGSSTIQFPATELQVRYVATFEVWNPFMSWGTFAGMLMTTPSWSFHSFIINRKLNILVEMDLWTQVAQVSHCTSFLLLLLLCVCINLHCRRQPPLGNFLYKHRFTKLLYLFVQTCNTASVAGRKLAAEKLHGLMWYVIMNFIYSNFINKL